MTTKELMAEVLEIFYVKHKRAKLDRDCYLTGTLMHSYHDGQCKLSLTILKELKQLAFEHGIEDDDE